jgi:hypothetical protein
MFDWAQWSRFSQEFTYYLFWGDNLYTSPQT